MATNLLLCRVVVQNCFFNCKVFQYFTVVNDVKIYTPSPPKCLHSLSEKSGSRRKRTEKTMLSESLNEGCEQKNISTCLHRNEKRRTLACAHDYSPFDCKLPSDRLPPAIADSQAFLCCHRCPGTDGEEDSCYRTWNWSFEDPRTRMATVPVESTGVMLSACRPACFSL